MTRGFPEPNGRHGDDGLTIGRKGMKPIEDFLDQKTKSGQPFLLWYAPFLPHSPHDPPKRLLEKYQNQVNSIHVAKYYAMCEWFDETCGQLIDLLKARQVFDNTLIVYVGDNGWIQDPESPNFAPRSKQSPYEGGVGNRSSFPGHAGLYLVDVKTSSVRSISCRRFLRLPASRRIRHSPALVCYRTCKTRRPSIAIEFSAKGLITM